MPFLDVQIMPGRSAAEKTRLLQSCSQAVVDSIAASLEAVRVELHETAPEHVMVAGEMGKELVMLRVALIEGRSDEKKAALIAALNRAVSESIGVSSQNIRVVLSDIAKTDIGLAGGITALAAGR